MTAEERAEAAWDAMLDNCDEAWGSEKDIAILASAIRAAENEALERAATIADRKEGLTCRSIVASWLRSLKSKEGK